jgi:hypothetical protein
MSGAKQLEINYEKCKALIKAPRLESICDEKDLEHAAPNSKSENLQTQEETREISSTLG